MFIEFFKAEKLAQVSCKKLVNNIQAQRARLERIECLIGVMILVSRRWVFELKVKAVQIADNLVDCLAGALLRIEGS